MPTKKNQKVLVVEDDHFLAKIYKIKLAKENMDAIVCSDGAEALELIKKEKPALILLDMVLPGMNGFEILEQLRKDKSTKKTPVIILSNLGQDADIAKGKELGVIDYFVKSDISIHDVVKKIKENLNG
ncbi:response regulator [Patescibacteria group bacterium]|nr:response regulator [Patescibacteria group bacterium]